MTTSALTPAQQVDFEDWQHGHGYNTFMRVAEHPTRADLYCDAGEFGRDGWLGTYFCDDPSTGTIMLLMYQLANAGTTEFTRRMKNIVFTHLD